MREYNRVLTIAIMVIPFICCCCSGSDNNPTVAEPNESWIAAPPSEPYHHTDGAIYSNDVFTVREVSAFGSYTVANIETADLDSDGDVDLILASEENNSIIQVYENLGDAVFRNSGTVFPFQSPDERHWNFGIAVQDFNGDSLPDIATADAWAGLNIYFNCGQLRFALAQNYTFEGMGEVKGIATADFDNDGDMDIVLGDHNGDSRGDRILLNDGSGKMIDSGQSIGWDITWDVFAIDINRDGATDYISVNSYGYEPTRIHFNNGAGVFDITSDIPDTFDDSYDVKCIANDDYTYCFIANSEGQDKRQNRMFVFDKTGELTDDRHFGEVGAETKDLRLVDINKDGLFDLVTANLHTGAVSYISSFDELGVLELREVLIFHIPEMTAIACEDFNADGRYDFVVGTAISDPMARGTNQYLLLIQDNVPK